MKFVESIKVYITHEFYRNIQQEQSQPGSDPRLVFGRFLQGSLQDLSEGPIYWLFDSGKW